jgi:glycolate oxidase
MALALPEPDRTIVRQRASIVADLEKLVPPGTIIADEEGRRAFETDALTAYRRMPLAVALPASTDEVSRLLRYCHANDIKVVARGAGTSLSGGALPAEDALVIGVSRMNRVLDIDTMNRTARVETGITNLGISDAVKAHGFFYAPDPSSQLACTLAAHLDAAGYDLMGLVIGSEGQFGIATEATVRILRSPESARPMLLGFGSSAAAGDCVSAIIAAGIIPVAIEFMDRPAIQVCEAFAKAGYPTDVEALLIVEVEGSNEEIADLLAAVTDIARRFNPSAVRVSQSPEQSAAIWKGRKSAFGAIGRISDYYCMDGVIPLGRLGEVLVEISRICDRHRLRVANIFHAGDGNLHPLILYDANDEAEAERAEAAGADILKLCVNVGGCLTGEHGVGIEKRDLMRVQFTPTDLALQMRIKTVFDPKWLLNPAKVFPLDGRDGVRDLGRDLGREAA